MFGTLGNYLTFSSFGESHGEAYGGILTNFPAGVKIDFDEIQHHQLNRRKPGQSAIVTQRKEADEVRFLSGIFEGKTTGMPIGFLVENENQKTKDYEHLARAYRPSHADYTYDQKFGFRDYRGGGRSSARETLNWVVAGTLAKHLLPEVEIYSYVSSVGEISCTKPYQELDFSKIDENEVRCPDETTAKLMIERIEQARKKGDTVGGTITCVIKNAPKGLGEPVFNKLHAELGKAMLGINACKGFEYGAGFEGAKMSGSAQNDIFNADGTTKTNHSGGIQGGISNGMDIYFRVAFKPISTLMMPQESIDNAGNIIKLEGKGRHDPCVLPRAVSIVDALSAFVLADMYIIDKQRKI